MILSVPYKSQIGEYACGLACLEMVERYYKSSKLHSFNQVKLYRRLKQQNNDLNVNFCNTDDIVSAARSRKFESDWGRFSPDIATMASQINWFIVKKEVPLIICHRASPNTNLGHFKVVIGIDSDNLFLHDPLAKVGPNIKMKFEEFREQWKPIDRLFVTGGVAIWISLSLLDPPLMLRTLNPWDDLA